MSSLDRETAVAVVTEVRAAISRSLTVAYVATTGQDSDRGHVEVCAHVFGASELLKLDDIARRYECSLTIHPQRRWRGGLREVLETVCEIRRVPR